MLASYLLGCCFFVNLNMFVSGVIQNFTSTGLVLVEARFCVETDTFPSVIVVRIYVGIRVT